MTKKKKGIDPPASWKPSKVQFQGREIDTSKITFKKGEMGIKLNLKHMDEFLKEDDPNVHNPSHYGGKDNPYEAIKVIEAHNLDFHLGNAVKYILRAGKKEGWIQDLKKAQWYLERKIEQLKALDK
jgi:hypothetical protein